MSLAAHAWAKSQKTGSPVLKAVLVAVADYADEAGVAWPSQVRIAEDTELSERAVRRALGELEAAGFLTRENRRRQDGSRATDRLVLALGAVEPQQPARQSEPPATQSEPPARQAATTGTTGQTNRHVRPEQPARGAGLTTFEPSENHQGNRQEKTVTELIAEPVVAFWPKDGFARFYQAYPRHQGRAEAEKAFGKLQRVAGVTFDAVMAGVRRLVESDPDPQFVPHPATWLNQRRWEDETLPAARARAGPSPDVRRSPPNPWLAAGGLLDQPDDPHRPVAEPDQPFARSRDPQAFQPGRGSRVSELRDPGRLRAI